MLQLPTTKIDFETIGNDWGWSKFETNSGWSIAPNPAAAGINTSANTMKVVVVLLRLRGKEFKQHMAILVP